MVVNKNLWCFAHLISQASLRFTLPHRSDLTRDSPFARKRTITLSGYGESRVKQKFVGNHIAKTRLKNKKTLTSQCP